MLVLEHSTCNSFIKSVDLFFIVVSLLLVFKTYLDFANSIIQLLLGLLNRFQWMQGLIPLCNTDILLFKSSISFIDHLQEFFGAILTSTPLIILPVNELKANPLCLVDFVKVCNYFREYYISLHVLYILLIY